MFRYLLGRLVVLLLWIAYRAHKAEGLNALFLLLPARLLAPVLRQHGAIIGEPVEMHTPVIFHNVSAIPGHHYENLKIGSDCYFGRDVFFDLADQLTVEDNVTVSMRVTILTHTHAGKSPLSTSRLRPSHAPVVLRHGCYLGAGAMILPGVEVGSNAIVGAGAVVTRNVKAGATVVGVPARPVHPT